MTGGVAAMVVAAEALATGGARPAGDLAALADRVCADGCVAHEPSNVGVCFASRGSLIPTITVRGRPGHAGMPEPHRREGGAVNAIEKSAPIMDAPRRLQEDRRSRRSHQHPHLAPGAIVATPIAGGECIAGYPTSCALTYYAQCLPVQADAERWGTAVEREITERVLRAAAADRWQAEQPPTLRWAPEVPPVELAAEPPVAGMALAAGAAVWRQGRLSGLQHRFDGATFTRAGTTVIAPVPADLVRAHTVDEYVLGDDLVATAQALALLALRFCGSADD